MADSGAASFGTDLIDGFPILYKRTEGTLKATHEVASFLNKVAVVRREYLAKLKGLIANYAQRKLLANADLDGGLKKAVEVTVQEMESLASFESTYTVHLSELSSEIENWKRERDARRKKLQSDGESMVRELQAQHSVCKRTKDNYVSLSKDAEKQQTALVKATSDQGVKSGKLAQMSTKTSMAVEKARAAEAEYKDVVRQTNDKQHTVYAHDMPHLLMEFQNFEEDRIRFVQDRLKRLASHLGEWPEAYATSTQRITEAATAIVVADDIAAYITANKTGKIAPAPLEVELYNGSGTGSFTTTTAPGATNSSGSLPLPTSNSSNNLIGGAAAAGTSASMTSGGEKWGLGAEDSGMSEAQKRTKLEAQMSKLEVSVRGVEQQIGALERMAAAYGNDPTARKKADGEKAELEKKLEEFRAIKERVARDLSSLDGNSGDPSGSTTTAQASVSTAAAPVAPAEGAGSGKEVKVRGVYDYTATCDTELSFKEGEIFVVTEQDASGWWYATINGKMGFVPENYCEVVHE